MKLKMMLVIFVVCCLSACQSIVGDTGATATPPPPPEPNMVIQWERDPSYIVFRADVSPDPNPPSTFIVGGEVPFCTIYGDGTVVWTEESPNGMRVLFGPVDDERIRRFVNWITVAKGIYTHGEELDLQMSSVTPVVETLYIHVNGIPHKTDAFAEWEPNYFIDILTECRTLSPQPQIFEPTGAWLSVQSAPFNPNANTVLWEPSVAGIDLNAIAQSGEPQWVTGQGLRLLWTYLQRSSPDLQFGQLDGNFVIILQIPNVTRTYPTPPPPPA